MTASRLTPPCSSSARRASTVAARVSAATTLRCGTPCHGSRLAWCSMSRYRTSPVGRPSAAGRQPARRFRESVVFRVKMTESSGPAADEVTHDVPGVLVDRRADLGCVAGAAVDAGVERQDFVEVGGDNREGRGGGAVVQVGVADVAALDQRGLDFGAGDGGERPAGNGKPFAEQGCGAGADAGGRGLGETVAVVTETSLERDPSSRESALAGSVPDRPGRHPGHPTANGGLPASKPGFRAGTRDLLRA